MRSTWSTESMSGRREQSNGMDHGPAMDEVDALRTHIRHLKHAVATTTCHQTVDVLQKMLRESETKLCRLDAALPADKLTGAAPHLGHKQPTRTDLSQS